jgi:hypothetical protein
LFGLFKEAHPNVQEVTNYHRDPNYFTVNNVTYYYHKDNDDKNKYTSVKPVPATSGSCFLTTACTQYKGLPDDCYELRTLRTFRDNYMRGLAGGGALIEEYYAIAPAIVTAIKANDDFYMVIKNLYDNLVMGSIRLIEAGKNREALENYKQIVMALKERYLK